MQQNRSFDLGDILSVTTGRLVSPRHMAGVYDILDYMTGDSLYTHQLPRAAEECRPYLLKQYPELAAVTTLNVLPEDNWTMWLNAKKAIFGDSLEVSPIPKDAHQVIDPISEAIQMMGGSAKVIVVELPE